MEDELDPIIVVSVHGHTSDKGQALKMVEVLSRLMVGLALDGIDISISVSVLDEADEYEDIDHGEDES